MLRANVVTTVFVHFIAPRLMNRDEFQKHNLSLPM